MKKNLLIFLTAMLANSILLAQDTEVKISSEIKNVTVFPGSAQVERLAKEMVPAGKSNLVFTGISSTVDPSSIQFKALGTFTILSVNHRLNYIQPREVPEKIQKLKDEQDGLRDELNIENAHLQTLSQEEEMILANKMIGSQQQGVLAENLAKNAAFLREHIFEIKKAKLDNAKRMAKLNEKINAIQQQINEYNAANVSKATSEIVVAVQADKKSPGEFVLEYIVNQASWKPVYDLRVMDVNNPVGLTYKALVSQNSGEDWKDVALSLATGNPSLGGTKPTMTTWWLRENIVVYAAQQKMQRQVDAAPTPYAYSDDLAENAGYAEVEQIERTTFTEFAIKLPQTIAADGKSYTVNIADYELPAEYVYYAAPKLDKNAFLTARVTGWEAYNLLNGEASLFFEGTYLGKSYINVATSNDTLDLSLGRDAGIVIKREQNKQYKDKQFLGRKVTRTTGWNITLRNTRKQDINIVIEDQIPVSTSDEIEVSLDASNGAKTDPATGILRWELKLKPGKTETLGFKYSVKYPRTMNLMLE